MGLVGLTWREAPTSLRAVAAAPLSDAEWGGLVAQGARGLVEVHTCARSLWVIDADDAAWTGALLQALVESRLEGAGAALVPQAQSGDEAVRALFSIAIGLDSFVEGEADVGGQVLDGFAEAASNGRGAADLAALARVVSRLCTEARRSGVVRRGRGIGQLAAENLRGLGVQRGERVGVVGAGRIGTQVRTSLHRAGFEPVVFNRTPREGTRPLGEIPGAGLQALVACTSAPAAWLSPPPSVVAIDLGRPAQVLGQSVGLDTILHGPGLRLDAETRGRAQALVERAMGEWQAQWHAHVARERLARVQQLREAFVEHEIEATLAPALDGLDVATRRRVLSAARQAVRRYSHAVIGALKEDR